MTSTSLPSQVSEIDKRDLSSRKNVKAIRHLISVNDYESARALATQILDAGKGKATAYALLVEIAEKEGSIPEAADHAKKAYELAPTSVQAVAQYMKSLRAVANYRAALGVYQQLSNSIQAKDEIRQEVSDIYDEIGWRLIARSFEADHESRDARSVSDRWRHFLYPLVGWALVRVERRYQRHLLDFYWADTVLNRVDFQSTRQAYRFRADFDKLAVRESTAIVRWDLIAFSLGGLYTLIAAAISVSVLIEVPSVRGPAQFLVALAAIAVVYMLNSVIWATNAFAYAFNRAIGLTAVISFPLIVLGSIGISAFANGWPSVLAVVAVTAGGLFEIAVAGWMVVTICLGYWVSRRRRMDARALAVGLLGDVLASLDKAGMAPGSEQRRAMMRTLEQAAQTIEQKVLYELRPYDEESKAWFARRLRGTAEAVRQMKKLLLAPSGDSSLRLPDMLRRQISAIANDDWRRTIYKQPQQPPKRTARDRVLTGARFVTITVLPTAVVLAVSPIVDFSSAAFRWSIVVSLGWAVLSILFALDPSFRDKVDTAKGVTSSWRDLSASARGPVASERDVNRD